MLKILLVSHGGFAEGIANAAEIIMGKQEQLSYINAYTSDITYEEQFDEYMSSVDLEKDKLIIVADLFGGSVNQKTMKGIDMKKVILITGLCLPMLLELLMLDEASANLDEVRRITEMSKSGLLVVNDLSEETSGDDFDF
ncbi:hypothetical protein J3A84_10210 [Proteiniclasticum sp. SCR006]|uniref:PTS EIIA type-4 domain-containing protein n=1 Tax=Proteiniclasticum aestuarii TaxID=2817862 RepID=A0A939HDQ2_9CLOT|nr:hypothetical protein [Proteiniclasticum aestuarii]MBO1265403.1 hypothetical protein [Proteiniclasticum aestuarii]